MRCDAMRLQNDRPQATAPAPTSPSQILPDSIPTGSWNWLHHETHILSLLQRIDAPAQSNSDKVNRSSAPGKEAKCTSAANCKMPSAQWSVRLSQTNSISRSRFTNTQACLNIFSVSFASQTSQPNCLPSFY